MAAIVGVIQPAIALIIVGGMLVALYSLLSLDGGPLKSSIIDPNGATDLNGNSIMIAISMQTLYLFNIWDSLFFILANTIMPSIGIFFIYNVSRYFNSNSWFSITVGLFYDLH
ncbi:hypothetical protein [Spiroplasma taiwanense]|uniref:Uncharacterized protein n=1 Tax=Spiroplasma taiwanense CT-1 TaxID=1276220 RepID=S5LSW9_9MOLU|nr:hypothetical protein [Spiroplasma taiwanense]AGR40764.1 hypothetical protein STAIW_v1c00690 [Spiroplasma taiwanense CT-1]